MKRVLIALTTCVAVALLAWPADTSGEQKKKTQMSKTMVAKLKCSQKLLEGLAMADYDKIVSNTEELIQLTKTEEWQSIKTPRYEIHNNEFRRTAENVIQKAKLKNIDGVTLAYFEMVMSCVRCHEYVREVRDANPSYDGPR